MIYKFSVPPHHLKQVTASTGTFHTVSQSLVKAELRQVQRGEAVTKILSVLDPPQGWRQSP